MAALANHELAETDASSNNALTAIHRLGMGTTEQLLFALSMLVLVLLVLSLTF